MSIYKEGHKISFSYKGNEYKLKLTEKGSRELNIHKRNVAKKHIIKFRPEDEMVDIHIPTSRKNEDDEKVVPALPIEEILNKQK